MIRVFVTRVMTEPAIRMGSVERGKTQTSLCCGAKDVSALRCTRRFQIKVLIRGQVIFRLLHDPS